VQPPTGFAKAGAVDHCIVKQQIKERSRAQQIATFPGTHPVTLARHHLPLIGAVSAVEAGAAPQTERSEAEAIGRSQYVVTDKLDGERYFFYLDRQQCWLIDRRLNVFTCPLSSSSEQGGWWNEDYADTLLDGELVSLPASVADADADSTGKRKRAETDEGIAARLHFVAFDAVTIGGTNLASLPFRERMEEAQKRLGGLLGSTRGPLALHIQRYVSLGELPTLLAQKEEGGGEESVGQLPLFPVTLFPTDGLILQNAASPYRVGHSDDLLKWKDPHHNTIDFRLLSPLTADSGPVPLSPSLGFELLLCVSLTVKASRVLRA
jgi:mRNA guanylyltransferase